MIQSMQSTRITLNHIRKAKKQSLPLVVLTAYEYSISRILDQAGVDILMVGDSLGMVALGYDSTLPVTVEEMLHHCKAVRRGSERAFLVADLPFLSYQSSPEQALNTAGRFLKEAGMQAVKLEGGSEAMVLTIAKLTQVGIPVMAHLGLTPQSIHQLGSFRQRGKQVEEQDRLLEEALKVEHAGAFALVLEHIPSALAKQITHKLTIPTIGIGAGPDCDGQVLVTHDFLGLTETRPPFAPDYLNLRTQIQQAVLRWGEEVRERNFPKS
jgi:3-methyl-2-oxobutanoate hydroxymethyltransferase